MTGGPTVLFREPAGRQAAAPPGKPQEKPKTAQKVLDGSPNDA
jgi:hypothetical protein